MRVLAGMAHKGPALGADKAVMGHAWWYWLPEIAWMDFQIADGRMRGLQMRWLCFYCDVCHFSRK